VPSTSTCCQRDSGWFR